MKCHGERNNKEEDLRRANSSYENAIRSAIHVRLLNFIFMHNPKNRWKSWKFSIYLVGRIIFRITYCESEINLE